MYQAISIPPPSGLIIHPARPELSEFGPDVSRAMRISSISYVTMSSSHSHTDLLLSVGCFGVIASFPEIRQINIGRLNIISEDKSETIAIRFERLAQQWKSAKTTLSSITAMAVLPQYQQIIGMGMPAVPLILSQLEREGDQPDMWFWALKAITLANPVSDEDRGDMLAMAKAWINWGRTHGVS